VSVAAVLIQLVVGAGFRHGAFGIIPHIIGAAIVLVLILATSILVLRRFAGNSFLTRPAIAAIVLVVVQVGLGISSYFARLASANDPQPLEPMISLTVMHLVVGALTLATILTLALRSHRVLTLFNQREEGASATFAIPRTAV